MNTQASPGVTTETRLIIKPTKWAEVWVGMFGIYNSTEGKDWELCPLTGLKLYYSNHLHILALPSSGGHTTASSASLWQQCRRQVRVVR